MAVFLLILVLKECIPPPIFRWVLFDTSCLSFKRSSKMGQQMPTMVKSSFRFSRTPVINSIINGPPRPYWTGSLTRTITKIRRPQRHWPLPSSYREAIDKDRFIIRPIFSRAFLGISFPGQILKIKRVDTREFNGGLESNLNFLRTFYNFKKAD